MNLYEKAIIFAATAHEMRPKKPANRHRKYTFEPYIVHPVAVAARLRAVTEDQEMLAAAVLHDVLEDTDTTATTIFEEFGGNVAMYVIGLTDISKPGDGKRSVRKAIDREHLAAQCANVQTIKVFDLIDNTESIIKHDKKFAKVYLKEMAELLAVLTKADPVARKLAEDSLKNSMEVYS